MRLLFRIDDNGRSVRSQPPYRTRGHIGNLPGQMVTLFRDDHFDRRQSGILDRGVLFTQASHF